MLIGYARVSTLEQSCDLQIDALNLAGCGRIFIDNGLSGCTTRRPGLDQALDALQAGDTLITWRLDRLGRSLPHLIKLIAELEQAEVGFRSLTEAIDTYSATGRLIFNVIAALAEFERMLISERTRAGLESAKARGAKIGRPRKLAEEDVLRARELLSGGSIGLPEVARAFSVSAQTVKRRCL